MSGIAGIFIRRWGVLFLSSLLSLPAVAADPAQLLLMAVSQGRERMTQDLLAQGADPNARNRAGRPALVLAAFHDNQRTLRALLAAGADANATDAVGNTALMEAAAFGHLKIVTDLLLSGADAKLKNQAGSTALQRAQLGGRKPVIELLQGVSNAENE
jgi:ankyrin repeat protein